jgi:cation:H+ antiporter
MKMIEPVIQFVLAASVIVVAGSFLAWSSDTIAEITKMGRLFVGSIFLAGATSLPELLVDASAIRKGMPDLAVGDLMGSSLFNLLILAIADLLHHNPNKIFSRAGARHALSASMSINMTAVAAIAILLGPQLHGVQIGDIGLGPLLIGLIYVLGLRLVYYDQQISLKNVPNFSAAREKRKLVPAISVYLICALAIFIASPYLAEAAGQIAEITGLGRTFVGTTLVAFCTSLPELVSTIAAVRMGSFDLAAGNIFGSNSFNMLIFIPLDWLHPGNLLGAVSSTHVFTALATILTTSVVVIGQLYQKEDRKKILEPDAMTVILLVFSALYILYWLGSAG